MILHTERPRCVVEGENHSTDLVEVYFGGFGEVTVSREVVATAQPNAHGRTEPAYACGFHATYHPALVFAAHNEAIRGAA